MSKLKGANFIERAIDKNEVFIPEEFTEEQIMIKDMVEDFCIKEIQEPILKRGRELYATNDDDRKEIETLLEKSAELGLCGVAIAERFGGMDLDFNTGLVFSEAIAAGFSFATTVGAQTSIGSLPIVYYGTEEQKAKYLPGVANASIKAAYALTEPSAGSDANSGKSKAVLSEDGKHYILNGQKMWITNGGFAHIFIVFAKIEDDQNLSAFIVEKAFGGVTIGAEEKKLGIKGSSTVQVFFNDCKVPVENLLSERGKGFKIALNILNSGRIKLAAGTTGGSKFAITKAVLYAIEREQFGQSIADFGAMKYKIAEMTTKTFTCDSAVYRTGKNIDLKTEEFVKNGMDSSEAKLKALREFAIECAILKVKGSDNLDYVVDEALQIHGGMGYSVETGIEMGYRDARITRIYEGTNEINRLLSVAELGKRAVVSKELDLKKAGKKIPGQLLKKLLPFNHENDFEIISNMKSIFLLLLDATGRKYREKLEFEQEIVLNLSNLLAEAFVAESAFLRVQKLKDVQGFDQEKLDVMKAMVKINIYNALAIVRNSSKEIIDTYATGFEKKKMFYLVKLLTKKYDVNPTALRRKIADYVIKEKAYCF
ncbi:MAG: alkylation response protein AidB-like acyl-CoA dehydrogenase [Planctomycetota bacterium]|jgi:alkylation response protein AidB-like acyl-CoA dehydrogenase